MIVAAKEWLSLTFQMKDMGKVNFVLGVTIVRNRSNRLLGLSLKTYIESVFDRFK